MLVFRMNHKEEQDQEIEALESIFPNEIESIMLSILTIYLFLVNIVKKSY
jgi:hypothetical protein